MNNQNKRNPFLYGFPVSLNDLPSRRQIILSVAERLGNGVSVALIGEPRLAKTSTIDYLLAPENRKTLFGDNSEKLIFKRIDCQLLPSKITQAEFWEYALSPILPEMEKNPNSELSKSYNTSQEKNFEGIYLSEFIYNLGKIEKRLILILDEFEILLSHTLNNFDFWRSLRSFSDTPRNLAVLISSRYPVDAIEEHMGKIELTGSPIFNLYQQIRLTTLPFDDVKILLGNNFSPTDCQYIYEVSGGHPYLVQVCASAMWEEFAQNNTDRFKRHLTVGEKVRENSKLFYSDLWENWPAVMRKAIAIIGLSQTPLILQDNTKQSFDFRKDLVWIGQEIDWLSRIGMIDKDESTSSGYRLAQKAMLWWLADEIVRVLRDDISFENWILDRQYIRGAVSRRDLRQVSQAAKIASNWLEKGASTLVEAYAKSLIK